MKHFVSASAGGPCSMCGRRSTHKVGEEIPHDEPCMSCGSTWWMRGVTGRPPDATDCTATYHLMGGAPAQRHNLTAYVCCRCFTKILGPATGCPVTTQDTVTIDGTEWALLQPVRVSDDGKLVGYLAIPCEAHGAARLPAGVSYLEFPSELLDGDDPG